MLTVVYVKNQYQRNRYAEIEELRMMSERIRLERTEVGGYVTLTPQGRVMYKIEEYEALESERDRWRDLAGVMHQYLIDNNIADALKAYEKVADDE